MEAEGERVEKVEGRESTRAKVEGEGWVDSGVRVGAEEVGSLGCLVVVLEEVVKVGEATTRVGPEAPGEEAHQEVDEVEVVGRVGVKVVEKEVLECQKVLGTWLDKE